jgi:hypothetical protein
MRHKAGLYNGAPRLTSYGTYKDADWACLDPGMLQTLVGIIHIYPIASSRPRRRNAASNGLGTHIVYGSCGCSRSPALSKLVVGRSVRRGTSPYNIYKLLLCGQQ